MLYFIISNDELEGSAGVVTSIPYKVLVDLALQLIDFLSFKMMDFVLKTLNF